MSIFKFIMKLVVTVVVLNSAQAYTVNSTYVGLEDTLLISGMLSSSGDATEQDFINVYFDPDISLYEKTPANTLESANIQYVDGSTDIFAFDLAYQSGFYLIKNASCKNSDQCENNTALFQNNEAFDWGVLSYDFLTRSGEDGGLGMHFGDNEFTISHVVSIGDIIQVAEPATLGLLTLGIVGLVGARRRQNQHH